MSTLVYSFYVLFFLLLSSCELTYDPSRNNDAPPTRGTELYQRFGYTETFLNPFTEEDLSKTMTLANLLDIALYNNPSTRASWYGARAAAYNYHVSLSSYYPTISYFGDYTIQQSNGGFSLNTGQGTNVSATTGGAGTTGATGATGSTHPTTVSTTVYNELSLSYLLLDFGGRDAQANLAWQMLLAANWQHDLTMQQVMLNVLNDYTSFLGNKGLVEANQQNLKDSQVVLDATLKMRQAGLATSTDVLSSQSTLAQTKYTLEQAKGAENTAFGGLLVTLGLPADANITVEDLPQELPVIEISGSVTSLIEMAKKNRPDIGEAIAAVIEQEDNLQISYSAGMPTLTLNANTSRLNFIHPKNPSIFNNNVSINWNVPIFQGFYYVNQQKQIKAQISEALANLDATVAQIIISVVTNYYALKTAEAALPSSKATLDYSQRAYKGMLSQYKVGTASITDVLTALTALSNARAQDVMTRTQWAASLANLAFSVGVLDDTSGEWKKGPPADLYKVKNDDNLKL